MVPAPALQTCPSWREKESLRKGSNRKSGESDKSEPRRVPPLQHRSFAGVANIQKPYKSVCYNGKQLQQFQANSSYEETTIPLQSHNRAAQSIFNFGNRSPMALQETWYTPALSPSLHTSDTPKPTISISPGLGPSEDTVLIKRDPALCIDYTSNAQYDKIYEKSIYPNISVNQCATFDISSMPIQIDNILYTTGNDQFQETDSSFFGNISVDCEEAKLWEGVDDFPNIDWMDTISDPNCESSITENHSLTEMVSGKKYMFSPTLSGIIKPEQKYTHKIQEHTINDNTYSMNDCCEDSHVHVDENSSIFKTVNKFDDVLLKSRATEDVDTKVVVENINEINNIINSIKVEGNYTISETFQNNKAQADIKKNAVRKPTKLHIPLQMPEYSSITTPDVIDDAIAMSLQGEEFNLVKFINSDSILTGLNPPHPIDDFSNRTIDKHGYNFISMAEQESIGLTFKSEPEDGKLNPDSDIKKESYKPTKAKRGRPLKRRADDVDCNHGTKQLRIIIQDDESMDSDRSFSTYSSSVEYEKPAIAHQKRKGRPPKKPTSEIITKSFQDLSGEDYKYRELRNKNNEASRRSRMNRREREQETEMMAQQLDHDNRKLRKRVSALEDKCKKLRHLLLGAMTTPR